jgi:hypothetical protein
MIIPADRISDCFTNGKYQSKTQISKTKGDYEIAEESTNIRSIDFKSFDLLPLSLRFLSDTGQLF